jgi:Holliday junction resolvase RusA-like endonuclease
MKKKITRISFTIPLKPSGQMRPRATTRPVNGRRIAMVYKHKKQRGLENQIAAYVVEAALGNKWKTRSNAFGMTLTAYFSIPRSLSKKKQWSIRAGGVFPEVKPDMTNIAKQIEDVCQGILFDDDKRNCDLHIRKFYGDPARIEVVLWDLV